MIMGVCESGGCIMGGKGRHGGYGMETDRSIAISGFGTAVDFVQREALGPRPSGRTYDGMYNSER